MEIHDALIDAARFAATQWQSARVNGREEEKYVWSQVSEFRSFISETGQVYFLEDYLRGLAPTQNPRVSPVLDSRRETTSRRVIRFLMKAFGEMPGADQKQSTAILIQLLNFIADTGQLDAVEDYVDNRLEYAPISIAQFTNRDEADSWLRGLSTPLSQTRILIADEYYLAWLPREEGERGMYRDYIIEPYIEEFAARGVPSAAPSFKTRAEAVEWLKVHPASPFAFVSVDGEYHFAVHHKWLKCHTLHPVASILSAWEVKKRAAKAALRGGDKEGQ